MRAWVCMHMEWNRRGTVGTSCFKLYDCSRQNNPNWNFSIGTIFIETFIISSLCYRMCDQKLFQCCTNVFRSARDMMLLTLKQISLKMFTKILDQSRKMNVLFKQWTHSNIMKITIQNEYPRNKNHNQFNPSSYLFGKKNSAFMSKSIFHFNQMALLLVHLNPLCSLFGEQIGLLLLAMKNTGKSIAFPLNAVVLKHSSK